MLTPRGLWGRVISRSVIRSSRRAISTSDFPEVDSNSKERGTSALPLLASDWVRRAS